MEQSKGQIAYEKHRVASEHDLPDWDELPELFHRTWEARADGDSEEEAAGLDLAYGLLLDHQNEP